MRRVNDPDDMSRCRATASGGGQCWNESTEEGDYCTAHGGKNNKDRDEMTHYLAEQFTNRLKINGGEIDEIKLLKENLMNLNAVIAAKTALMSDEASMLAHGGSVIDLIMKAEKVTASLHRLSLASGLLLAKPALVSWGIQVIQAVAHLVEDKYDGWEDDLDAFSHTLEKIIVAAKNEEIEK